MRYDATAAPDPHAWLQGAEGERLDAVLRYHKRMGECAGGVQTHATIHLAVETQLAEGLAVTVRTMARLLEQGLDRHDALHAIGSALAEQIYAAVQGRPYDATGYEARLDALTAESWRHSGERD